MKNKGLVSWLDKVVRFRATVCIKWLITSSSLLKAWKKSLICLLNDGLAAFYVFFRPRKPFLGAFYRQQIKPTADIPRWWVNGEKNGAKIENISPQEAEWVTGIERTRDWTIWVCLCFDCGPLCCICSLIRWEQLHCDWELAAWGIMRGSISAHRASKGKSTDPLWWKIILMIGDLLRMPVLVKTLSLVHSLPLFLLVAHITWKTSTWDLQFQNI